MAPLGWDVLHCDTKTEFYWNYKYPYPLCPVFSSTSEIPELSLCPPDSECVQLQLADSLPRPCSSSSSSSSSSSQLYHQVPQGPPYHPSPQPPSRHPPEHGHCCTHHQPTRGNACPNTHPVTDGSHPDCSTGLSIGGKTGHGRSPAHVPSCHNAVRCHWLQGSHEGGAQKRKQRHVVTVRYGFFCNTDWFKMDKSRSIFGWMSKLLNGYINK